MFLPSSSKSTLQSESTALTTDFPSLKREKSFGPADPPPPENNSPQQAEESLDALWGLPGSGLLCQYLFHVSSTPQLRCCECTPCFQRGRLGFQNSSRTSPPTPVPPLRASWLRKGSSRRGFPHAPRPSALLPESTLP